MFDQYSLKIFEEGIREGAMKITENGIMSFF
jgi:hypothetical protein